MPILRAHGISYLASHALASSSQSGKHIDADGKPTGRFAKSSYATPEVSVATKSFVAGCEAQGLSPVEVASRWIAQHPLLNEKDCIVLGASKLEQVRETVANIRKGSLPAQVGALVDQLWEAVKPIRSTAI